MERKGTRWYLLQHFCWVEDEDVLRLPDGGSDTEWWVVTEIDEAEGGNFLVRVMKHACPDHSHATLLICPLEEGACRVLQVVSRLPKVGEPFKDGRVTAVLPPEVEGGPVVVHYEATRTFAAHVGGDGREIVLGS